MTRTWYIHYTERHNTGVLVSDRLDESQRGYTLGLEIDCDCFIEALKSMNISAGLPIEVQGDVVTNANLSTFKKAFMKCMEYGQFEQERYCVRELHDNSVTWYERNILPKL